MKTIETIRYTPLDEVAETIQERRDNEALQAKLAQMLGDDIPAGPFAEDVDGLPAVYAEYLARLTVKDWLFARAALGCGLEPWWVTYERDTFTDVNKKKASMRRPKLAFAKGQQTKAWIVPEAERKGGEMGATPTVFDEVETVAEYWRRLRMLVISQNPDLLTVENNVYDISEWYWRQAASVQGINKAPSYYPKLMGLYASRAVLFRDFGAANPVFRPIAEAGYRAAAEALGVEPVIVKFRPPRTALSGEGREISTDQTDLTFLNAEQIASLQKNGYVTEENNNET